MRTDILGRKEEILSWIEQNKTKAFMCRQLKCKQSTLNSYLVKMGIEYAGNQAGIGLLKSGSHYKSAEEYAVGSYVKSSILKDKLIRDGKKENKCELCGISSWFGVEIVLELHHKNGDHYDNDLDNLQILCPNCHAIQSSHESSRHIYNQNADMVELADTHL